MNDPLELEWSTEVELSRDCGASSFRLDTVTYKYKKNQFYLKIFYTGRVTSSSEGEALLGAWWEMWGRIPIADVSQSFLQRSVTTVGVFGQVRLGLAIGDVAILLGSLERESQYFMNTILMTMKYWMNSEERCKQRCNGVSTSLYRAQTHACFSLERILHAIRSLKTIRFG